MTKPLKTSNNAAVVFATRQEYILHLKYYLTAKQEKEVITTLGYVCFVVLNHYLRKANMDDYNFSDTTVASTLGMPVRTVKNTRQKLSKVGWFIQRIFRNTGSTPITVTAIGKERVQALKACTADSFQKILNDYLTSERIYETTN